MSNTVCRSCREVMRRQLLNPSAIRTLTRRNVATHHATHRQQRRHLHQTSTRWQENAAIPTSPAEPSATSPTSETLGKIAATSRGSSFAMPYQAYGSTLNIYRASARAADYKISAEDRKNGTIRMGEDGEELGVGGGVWHEDLGLPPSFSTWSQVTMLHMYLIVVRLRCLDKESWQAWQSSLVNHFFTDAEEKMVEVHDLKQRVARSRYLKDLFQTWRGVILAYDEGLVKGDAVLAAAVWRNLYKGKENVDPRHLAVVVGWMRMVLKSLDSMLDPSVTYHGASVFELSPKAIFALVDEPSKEMKSALASAETTS